MPPAAEKSQLAFIRKILVWVRWHPTFLISGSHEYTARIVHKPLRSGPGTSNRNLFQSNTHLCLAGVTISLSLIKNSLERRRNQTKVETFCSKRAPLPITPTPYLPSWLSTSPPFLPPSLFNSFNLAFGLFTHSFLSIIFSFFFSLSLAHFISRRFVFLIQWYLYSIVSLFLGTFPLSLYIAVFFSLSCISSHRKKFSLSALNGTNYH